MASRASITRAGAKVLCCHRTPPIARSMTSRRSILVQSRLQNAPSSIRCFATTSLRFQQVQHAQQDNKDGSQASTSSRSVISDQVRQDRPEPGWAMTHSRYTEEELNNVKVVHKKLDGFGDRIASLMVGIMRFGFDIATRYPKHQHRFPRIKGSETNSVKVGLPKLEQDVNKAVAATKMASSDQKSHIKTSDDLPEEMELGEMRKKRLCFGPDDWLIRIVFLESIAGVPGMVAAACRHLHSLRLLRRDKGWINTMLEDAANERQHLLVALKLYKPGVFMRTTLLFAQGVFYNFFFLFYLVAPRIAHRFVGVLEEEAVYTYSRIIDDLQANRLPEWENHPAPQIAIDYWGLKQDAKILDVMRALRADEANHRYINHTLASLKAEDFNPFAYGDAPAKERGLHWGLTRDEAIQYFEREDAKRRIQSNQRPGKEERKNDGSGREEGSGPFAGSRGTPA